MIEILIALVVATITLGALNFAVALWRLVTDVLRLVGSVAKLGHESTKRKISQSR